MKPFSIKNALCEALSVERSNCSGACFVFCATVSGYCRSTVRHAGAFGLRGEELPRLLRADEVLLGCEAGGESATHSADVQQ